MLNQPTFDKLCAMRLRGMAEALQQQMQEPDIHHLSFEERIAMLIDRNGTGVRTVRWNGGCAMRDCKEPPVWRTSTTAHRVVLTVR